MSIEINSKQTVMSKEKLLEMLKTMLLIRHFEERIYYLFLQGIMPGTMHLYKGEEAVAAGVCANLTDDDIITSTHRPHGHAIAKGVSIESMMAELFAKKTGCCKGKGGSMHIGDLEKGMLTSIAIVGGNIPVATGCALAFKMRKENRVAVSFFGDGATNEGAFHEAVNMAAIWDLPILFVCENNFYGASTPASKVMKITDIADRASAYGIQGKIVDGNDVTAVYAVTHEAVEKAKHGKGPTLIECKTYRHGGHSRTDGCGYRPKGEKEEWLKKDPIVRLKKQLIKTEIITEVRVKEIEKEIEQRIDKAVEFAKSSPAPQDLFKDVLIES